MNEASDTSPEMHNESISPEDVERLFDGNSDRPDLADLECLFAEVRALPSLVQQPPVSAALAEFIVVDLTPTIEPLTLPESPETVISLATEAPVATTVRRKTMIGHAAAFLGTMGGKVAVSATLAAASVGGAHATGAVDVPFLPDTEAAVIETVDVPDGPDTLAFFEEVEDVEDVDKDVKEHKVDKDAVDDSDTEESDKSDQVDESDKVEDGDDDLPPRQPTKDLGDDEVLDENEPEKDPIEEEKKAEEPKKKDEKVEPKEEDGKTEKEKAAQEEIAALDVALHIAKDQVRADATALITPLEVERDGLLADLEASHQALAAEWEPVIDGLLADLEATEGEEARAEIEADIDAAEIAWADARVAAELEVDPRLAEINVLFHQIETERDDEINRLIAEFFAAVEVIEKSL